MATLFTNVLEMGNKIKTIPKGKRITLRMLGNLCELDYGNICRIKSGQKDSHILTLKNIADKLDVDVNDFF